MEMKRKPGSTIDKINFKRGWQQDTRRLSHKS